jgi:DNA polymerase III delta prime subunit
MFVVFVIEFIIMNKYQDLWVQKYAPQSLDEIVLSEENREFFSSINEDTPHLLFYGNAGTGKTTLAKIIVKNILKCQYLYINASDENGVDTIRNKVISFSQTRSLDGKKKVIILDEFCGTTPEAQRILRNVMEEYASTTRFILTANYINRITEPIRSRCLIFNIQPKIEDILKRCSFILKSENVKVEDIQKEKLVNHINLNFPDMRRIINDLQKFSIQGHLNISTKNQIKDISQELFKKLLEKKGVLEIRKFVIEEEKNFASDYQNLMKELFDLIFYSKISEDKKKSLLLDIGEHMYRDNFVIDHEINFFCCLMNLHKSFN